MCGENPSVCRNHREGYFLSVKSNGLEGGSRGADLFIACTALFIPLPSAITDYLTL